MKVHFRAVALGVAFAVVPGLTSWAGPEGAGTDAIGLFYPTTSRFFLRDTNDPGPPLAGNFRFDVGVTGVAPLTGDWDGDGDETVGLFNPETSHVFLRNSNDSGLPDAGEFFFYITGLAGIQPLTGDWNGS
jgi:hypothetical protein